MSFHSIIIIYVLIKLTMENTKVSVRNMLAIPNASKEAE